MNTGFTLLEAILTVMVVAMVFVGIAPMIAAGSQAYLMTRAVQPAMDQARLALERMRREIRQGDCSQNFPLLFSLTGSTLYFQQTYRLATNIQSLAITPRQDANSCLVTVSFTLIAPLPWDNQTMAIPFRTSIMVKK